MPTTLRLLAAASLSSLALVGHANAQQWAIRFADAELVLPHHPIMNTGEEVTIEGWIRSSGQPSAVFGLFERYKGGQEHKGLTVLADGAVNVIYAGSPWSGQLTAPGAVPIDDSWHHVAFVRSLDGTYSTFVDGVVELAGGPGPCWLTCNIINSDPSTKMYGASWDVRSVRVSSVPRYSSAFVPADAWDTDAETVLLLDLEEGAGNVVSDSGPAGQVGTLTGGFEWVPATMDCDGDGIPNSDEIAQGAPDCNGNGIPDECDVTSGFSLDQDSNGVPDECSPPLLAASPTELDALAGGTQTFTLTAGPDSKLDLYLLLGSISGTSPGVPLGDLTLPLNIVDPCFDFTLEQPNSAALVNTLGVLDIQGTATASVNVPTSAQYPSLIGLTFHHAYVVLGNDLGVSLVSNSVELKLLP